MKKNKILLLVALFVGMCLTCEAKPKGEAKKLLKRLTKIQAQGYMMGHQDDPMYGLKWMWDRGRSDVKETVGDYPAVMGFDLGGIEMCDAKNLDSVPFTRIREELIAHYERGGIVTLSWHPRNPLTGGTSWDVTSDQVVKSVLPGGSQHTKFCAWMTRVGDFLETLKTSKGKRIPIIFRPWHENNGSWFWWGEKLCSDEEYLALWNMLQDELNRRGFKNLLWSYSPNLHGQFNEEYYLRRYPGNDRVDLIGEDAYQWGTEADFKSQLTKDLDFVSQFAKKNGKLFALTECGMKNLPDPTWLTRVLKPIMDKYEISYFLLWRNYREEFFAPDPTHPAAQSLKDMHSAKNILFLQDIKNIK